MSFRVIILKPFPSACHRTYGSPFNLSFFSLFCSQMGMLFSAEMDCIICTCIRCRYKYLRDRGCMRRILLVWCTNCYQYFPSRTENHEYRRFATSLPAPMYQYSVSYGKGASTKPWLAGPHSNGASTLRPPPVAYPHPTPPHESPKKQQKKTDSDKDRTCAAEAIRCLNSREIQV